MNKQNPINRLAKKIWWKSWAYKKMYPRTLSKRIRIDLISQFLPINNNLNVLDIGCGAGYISSMYNAYGIDMRLSQLKWAGKEFPSAKFISASAEKLPFKNKSFDSILCIEVIEHLEDCTKLFCEVDRIIKDNGSLIISTPSTDGFFKPPSVEEHIKNGYTFKELDDELNKHNFTIIQVKYYNKIIGYLMWVFFHHTIHNMKKMPSAVKYLISTIQFSPLFPILYSIYKLDMSIQCNGAGIIIKAKKMAI